MKKTTLNKQARLAREKEEGENAVRREDRRDAGTGSRDWRAAPCDHQSQRT